MLITSKKRFLLKKIFVFLWVKWWKNFCFCLKTHRKSLKKIARPSLLTAWVYSWVDVRFIYIALTLYKHACKTVCDVNPGKDPGPSQAWLCKFFRWFSVTLTAHKISSFQAKTIILSSFYSQKHKDFFKRKTILGVIGSLMLDCLWIWQGDCVIEVKTEVSGEKRLPWTCMATSFKLIKETSSSRAKHWANSPVVRIISPSWFDHLQQSFFFYKETQFSWKLRWLETVSSTYILMGRYNYS